MSSGSSRTRFRRSASSPVFSQSAWRDSSPLPLERGSEIGPCHRGTRCLDGASRQRCVESGRDQAARALGETACWNRPSRNPRSATGGRAAAPKPPESDSHMEPLRHWSRVRLLNPHNVCYINSSVTFMAWTWAGVITDRQAAYGTLMAGLSAILTAKHQYVPRMISWVPVLQSWMRVSFWPSS